MDLEDGNVNEIIWEYAQRGITYKAISNLLTTLYKIKLSPNAIKKRLHRRGFPKRRGPPETSEQELKSIIQKEIEVKPYTVGYRCMFDTLRTRGYHVRRDLVMKLMKEVDPAGCEFRRRRRIVRRVYSSQGPNDTWHIDGYDKLKPYGLSIHGCIDGFSRKIMWLAVGASNNDPHVIAKYFLKCVEECGGCPSLLQSDPGTENVIVGSLQSLFHKSDESFRIVRSTFNQRIEAWWSMLRRRFTTWCIDFFRDLASFGAFEMGNENDMRCVRVCFSYLVQKELDEVKESWNHHHISRSRQAVVPNGKPVLLFSTPEVYGAKDCLKDIDEDDFTWGCSLCPKDSLSGSYDFDNVASQTLLFKNWKYPASWKDCLENYFLLRDATTPNNNESIS